MRAGRLNKRVTIQAPATGQDELGQPIIGWENLVTAGDGTIAAEVKDQSGREYVAAGAVQAAVLTTITIRPRDGVAASMRVLHGADIYGIEAVLRPYRDQMALMCKRLSA